MRRVYKTLVDISFWDHNCLSSKMAVIMVVMHGYMVMILMVGLMVLVIVVVLWWL